MSYGTTAPLGLYLSLNRMHDLQIQNLLLQNDTHMEPSPNEIILARGHTTFISGKQIYIQDTNTTV